MNLRETYDFAVSRAVAQLNTLAEYCLALCQILRGGSSLSRASADDELESRKECDRYSRRQGEDLRL